MLGGMLLTNSCDIVRNDNLQLAAMTPIDEYSKDAAKQEAIRAMRIMSIFTFRILA